MSFFLYPSNPCSSLLFSPFLSFSLPPPLSLSLSLPGAEEERSGTAWDELYYDEMKGLATTLASKPVAVFGLGDSGAYCDNFADASGELHDVFEKLGAKMFGYTDVDGSYEHTESKAQRGEKFVGLMCDQINQDDLTEGRVDKWVAQLQVRKGWGVLFLLNLRCCKLILLSPSTLSFPPPSPPVRRLRRRRRRSSRSSCHN